MSVEGEWRWFTALRLALARATFWTCCKLIVWSFRLCLAPDHPMRIYADGWWETNRPFKMQALRQPIAPRRGVARVAIVAVPTLAPVVMMLPASWLA